MSLRNIAIIAHVDHGKTTLVDKLLQQSGTLKQLEGQNLIMDHNDQERERGITIYAKNTSVIYKDTTINIIDTPGHADFWSEVERVMRMVDCVLLVVDAYEGPMPQTKFVLKKSLELGLKPLVVINKIDKPTARPHRVIDQLFDLFIVLGATDEQLDFPIIYASAKNGYALKDLPADYNPASGFEVVGWSMEPLFDMILDKVPPAPSYPEKPFRMQIANLGYDEFFGRLGIGRIYEGSVKIGQAVNIITNTGKKTTGKIMKLFRTIGLNRVETSQAESGDIVTISWIPDIYVGDTIGVGDIEALPAIHVDEPTLTMDFLVNDSPFAWREGKFVTSRNLQERLAKELETNVGLKVDFTEKTRFTVSGRGELHLSVLIETMRREGFELQVSAPQVIFKTENGKKMEPIEQLVMVIDDTLSGAMIQELSNRKGVMNSMQTDEHGQTTLEFLVPTRGLLGLRSWFILQTKGEGLMSSSLSHYEEYKGEIAKRQVWSMIASEGGTVMNYSIFKLQDRGRIFVLPGQQIYEGMLLGEHSKGGDLGVNMTKNKQLTNVRNSGNDEAMRLTPIVPLSLEEALSYIGDDEYVEITPQSIRLRKQYLTESARSLAKKK